MNQYKISAILVIAVLCWACADSRPDIVIEGVSPMEIKSGETARLSIIGQNFISRVSRNLSDKEAFARNIEYKIWLIDSRTATDTRHPCRAVVIVSSTQLAAWVSSEMPIGEYRVLVQSPFGDEIWAPSSVMVVTALSTPATETDVVTTDNTYTETTDINTGQESPPSSDSEYTPVDTELPGINTDSDERPSTEPATNHSDTDTYTGECEALFPNSLACVDFESEESYTTIEEGGQLELNDQQFNTGAFAMTATTYQDQNIAAIEVEYSPVTTGSIYFRAYYYLTSWHTESIKLFGLRGDAAEEGGEVERVADIFVAESQQIAVYDHNTGNISASASGAVPIAQWFCLSGEMKIEYFGSVSVSVDEVPVLTAPYIDTTTLSGITASDMGIAWTGAGQGMTTLYFDDIVIDTKAVGCQTR